jgi:hypothetical protein
MHKGRCGVWLTSDDNPGGHGLEGSAADKSRFRLTVNVPDDNPAFVRWLDWAPKNATPHTIRTLHATAPNFESWYVFFGVIDRSAIEEVIDMANGAKIIEDWSEWPPSEMDVQPVPPWRRTHWHKKLLRKTRRVIAQRRAVL